MGIPFFFASVQILANRPDLPLWPLERVVQARRDKVER
jgi:hypothetical protein